MNNRNWYIIAGHCLYWLLFFLFDWLATSGKVGRIESEVLLKEAAINFVSAALLAYSSIYWFRANWFDGRYRRLVVGIVAFILLAGLLKHAMKTVFIYIPMLETHISDVPSWLNYWKPRYILGSIVTPVLQASIVVMAYFFSLWTRQQRLVEKAKREKVEAELELLKSQVEPHFIFNTLNNIYYLAQDNHRDYAVESYDYDVLDYLVKPIQFDRFLKAVGKYYQKQMAQTPAPASQPDSFEQAYLFFRVDREQQKVWLKDILYIEGLGDYVKVFTASGPGVTYERLSYLEEKLPEEHFLRVHKSYIISTDKVQSFSGSVVKIAGKQIPVGRMFKGRLARFGR